MWATGKAVKHKCLNKFLKSKLFFQVHEEYCEGCLLCDERSKKECIAYALFSSETNKMGGDQILLPFLNQKQKRLKQNHD